MLAARWKERWVRNTYFQAMNYVSRALLFQLHFSPKYIMRTKRNFLIMRNKHAIWLTTHFWINWLLIIIIIISMISASMRSETRYYNNSIIIIIIIISKFVTKNKNSASKRYRI